MPTRTGSVGVPPWIHSELDLAASLAWSAVSSIVVAPAIDVPGMIRPMPSRLGIDASVVTSVENGEVTIDSEPHGPRTGPPMPRPSVNSHPVIGVQFGCVAASIAGLIGCPAEYGVSAPRALRLSWVLLRARLAPMAVYVGH